MSTSQKKPYSVVFPVASHIVETLRPYCDRIEIAGSLRRKRQYIGDIEIVAIPKQDKDLFGNLIPDSFPLDQFLQEKQVKLSKNGKLYKQFTYGSYTVDLFLPTSPAHWGSIYSIRTGSHEFNLWLMNVAAPNAGVKFDKGLIYSRTDFYPLNTPEEADVFGVLNLPFIPVDKRDDREWLTVLRPHDALSVDTHSR